MPRAQVRRAVDMANDLGADLAVVTGDFITGASDRWKNASKRFAGSPRRLASMAAMAITKFMPTPKTARRNYSLSRA